MDKLKTTASIFELPKRLGIIQYIEYELPLRDRCPDGEKCEGVLVAEGCRRGGMHKVSGGSSLYR
jgi:hypothetical protein